MSSIPTSRYSPLPIDEMPIMDLIKDGARAIKGDEAINNWSTAYYQQAVNITIGLDPEDIPKKEIYPLVDLYPIDGGNQGREAEDISRIMVMTCGLYDPETENMVYQDIQMQRGLARLDEFFRLAITALAGADLQGGYISELRPQFMEEILFPFFLHRCEIEIVKPL